MKGNSGRFADDDGDKGRLTVSDGMVGSGCMRRARATVHRVVLGWPDAHVVSPTSCGV